MASRRKIGLLFVYDESWAGGMYYLLNIVNALNRLSDHQKPELVIFYASAKIRDRLKKELNYPFFEFLPFQKRPSLIERIFAKLIRVLFRRGYVYTSQYSRSTVHFAFPCDYNAHVFLKCLKKVRIIYWIPDFQHKFLPHFFDREEIERRDKRIGEIARSNVQLVLSSESAKADFLKFYPANRVRITVMPFASVLPSYEHLSIGDLFEKYGIAKPYFMSPNQFWKHKNHIVLLEAVALLKPRGYRYKVVFTGKENDYRNPNYITELKRFVSENGIEEYVCFLGFIDRAEQLQLMQNAVAVVQPSLFEGWSTVVEDSKAMGQVLILSDLKVHREQCGSNAVYFDPADAQELATHLVTCLSEKVTFQSDNYRTRISQFAEQIIDL
jgi:glycosyltransferase involved in cell wall biosynthesis